MKAFDIAGRRGNLGVNQRDLAEALGWDVKTVRDVELGNVDITEAQYKGMLDTLDKLSQRKIARKAEEVMAI